MKTLLKITSILVLCANMACSKSDSNQPKEETYPIAHVETRLGDMYFWLHNSTPNHKAKFIELANENYYNDFTFNRVVKNFVIQGGCPDSVQYFQDSPYLLDPEFVDSLGHIYGALGMGRDGNPEKQSNACQIYIVNKESGLPNLDGDYMIFGQIIKGTNVLEAIEDEPTNQYDMPNVDIPLTVSVKMKTETELSNEFGFSLP